MGGSNLGLHSRICAARKAGFHCWWRGWRGERRLARLGSEGKEVVGVKLTGSRG